MHSLQCRSTCWKSLGAWAILGQQLEGQGRVARKLHEVVAIHGLAEAVPFLDKAAIGNASRHCYVIEEVPVNTTSSIHW